MQHCKVFKNNDFLITIYSQDAMLLSWIGNILDFPDSISAGAQAVPMTFYWECPGDGAGVEESFFSYAGRPGEAQSFSARIADVRVDAQQGVVRARVFYSLEALKERILYQIFFMPFYEIMASRQVYFIHAAFFSRNKRGLLVVGARSSGKTTLALLMAQKGFSIHTDDDCFLYLDHKQQSWVLPLPTYVGLNDKNIQRYPALSGHVVPGFVYGGKRRVSRQACSGSPESVGVCRMCLFPRYDPGQGQPELRLLTVSDVMEKFLDSGLGVTEMKFWSLWVFARRIPAYELMYNDDHLSQVQTMIEEVITSSSGS